MAPALTEPLNAADKLSSATSSSSPNTRSSKRLENASPLLTRERRTRSVTNSPTLLTRKKRAKVISLSIKDSQISGTVQVAQQTDPVLQITDQVLCHNNNEQMGLSAAPVSTNNNSINNNNYNNGRKIQSIGSATDREPSASQNKYSEESKDNSTEQLLADLTNDFEEAITAEICLRRQLIDSNIEKSRTSKAHDTKDIIVIKVSTGGAQEVDSTHMESPIRNNEIDDNATKEKINNKNYNKSLEDSIKHESTQLSIESHHESKQQFHSIQIDANEIVSNEKITNQDECKSEDVANAASLPDTFPQKLPLSQQSGSGSNEQVQVQGRLEELPTVSTDSTMSASEVEDNIEERLSQLDGNTNAVAITAAKTNIGESLAPNRLDEVHTTHVKDNVQQQILQISSPVAATTETVPAAHHTTNHHLHHHQQQQQQQPQQHQGVQHSNSSVNVPACGELEDQDLEEVLKALKGFDGNSAFDGDLNNLFNEVYTTLNYDDITSSGSAGVNNIASIHVPSSTSLLALASTSTTAYKPANITPLEESQAEIKNNHTSMQRRIDNLIKRIRKIQARHMCKHISEEIAGLFEWSARHCSKGITANNPTTLNGQDDINSMHNTPFKSIIASRPPATYWTDEKKNILPLRQVSLFMRRLDSAATAQQINAANANKYAATATNATAQALPIRRSKKMQEALTAAAAASTASGVASGTGERKIEEVVPTYDTDATEELTQVTGLLHTEMREVQNAYDSDATESSSGGESADEMVVYNNQLQQTRSISKRSPYRYSRDRGAIASRWCWLVSQVADLEIRIRQLQDLSHEVRRTKGTVICGLEHMLKPTESAASKGINGYKGSGYIDYSADEMNESEALPDSARTRGFESKIFRKRKLLQTANIHTISKKAARPSTIKCGCQWPLHPCALCTGRADPTAPRDPPDTMMKSERVALLDPCYHPVLSFPEDVTTTIHFEAIACQADWQLRVMRCQAKSIAKSIWKAEREAAAAAGHNLTSRKYGAGSGTGLAGIGETVVKRRYIKKKDRLAGERAAAADAVPLGNASLAGSIATSTTSTSAGLTPTVAGATAASTSSLNDEGNDVMTKQRKNRHDCHPAEEATAMQSSSQSLKTSRHTSDYHQTKYEQCNPNRTHTSSISNTSSSRQQKGSQQKAPIPPVTNVYQQQQQQQQPQSSQTIFNPINSNMHNNSTNNNSSLNNNQYINGNSFCGEVGDNWDRSRTSSPTHSQHKYERSFDRKNRSSYDIDNIVIPYSVAAATRVEILPYKEIPTPKWRLIEDAKLMQHHDENNEIAAEAAMDEIPLKEEESQFQQLADRDSSQDFTAPEKVDVVVNEINNTSDTLINSDFSASNSAIASSESTDRSEAKALEECQILNNEPVAGITSTETRESTIASIKDEQPSSEECDAVENSDTYKTVDEQEPNAKKIKVDTEANVTSLEIPQKESSLEENQETNEIVKLPVQEPTEEIKNNVQEAATSGGGTTTTTQVIEFYNNTELLKPPPPPPLNHINARQEATAGLLTPNGNIAEEEDEVEDISDDAMILRHERALAEERRKFQTFLKFPWSTRSRANRRMDSRTESSGANTPDPASPAPRTPSVGGGDNESIPSPLAPSTPMETIAEINDHFTSAKDGFQNHMGIYNSVHKRYERRRTTSAKREAHEQPSNFVEMPPYEPLKFPLSNELYQHMQSVMPNNTTDDAQSPSSSVRTNSGSMAYHHDFANTSSKNKSTNHSDVSALIYGNRRAAGKSPRIAALKGRAGRKRGRKSYSDLNGTTARTGRRSKDFNGPVNADDEDDDEVDNQHYNNFDDDDDEDDEFSDYFMDVEEDDYPKHHLAPPIDSVNGVISYNNLVEHDDQYRAYVGAGSNKLINSDGESSESEPFQDDDPNDPEWKGGGAERIERSRRKL